MSGHGTTSRYQNGGCRCDYCKEAYAIYRRNTRPRIVGGPKIVKESPDWWDDAACRGMDPALFFLASGEGIPEAREACEGCPIRARCLNHAIENNEEYGMWGGRSERQRRAIKRSELGKANVKREAENEAAMASWGAAG